MALLAFGYRLAIPVAAPSLLPVALPVLVPLVPLLIPSIVQAESIPIMVMPRGSGVANALEGGISSSTVQDALGAAFTYNYQSWGQVPMLRARDYGSVAWSDMLASVQRDGVFVFLFNEPESSSQDNLKAVDAARILREWNAAAVHDGKPVAWGGMGILVNGNAGIEYERAYYAAGGVTPPVRTCHIYGYDAAGLLSDLQRYKDHCKVYGGMREIIVSEIGGVPGISAEKRLGVLRAAFNLEIPAWAWFSALYDGNGGVWSANNLLNSDATLTVLGTEFRRLSAEMIPPIEGGDTDIFFPIAGR